MEKSLIEVNESVDTTKLTNKWRKFFSFIGPAYLVSVGYMDPGNWATDLEGGSKFGYALIWVLLMSNLMALLLQSFSSKLGIVANRDLAQINREIYPKPVNFILYVLAELAIAATDLAEVLGMAIGIQLLTGLPLIWGVAITVFDTFLLLYLQKLGIRKMEAFIIGLVSVVAVSFLIQIIMAKPNIIEVSSGLVPSLPNKYALYVAIGIIGATVMPHNLYLHSALVQTRKFDKNENGIKKALKYNFIDSAVALNIAFLVNSAILILAATVFYKNNIDVAEIKDAHKLLQPLLGSSLAPILFAVALIAAGQSSTITGTLAGQIVMEGYLNLRINPWLRRLITRLLAIVPALIVIAVFGETQTDKMLVLSQVLLSLQLAFAIVPLIHAVSNKNRMKQFVIKPYQKLLGWLIASILIVLNSKMLFDEVIEIVRTKNSFWSLTAILFFAGYISLFLYVLFYPIFSKPKLQSINMHKTVNGDLKNVHIPQFNKIAIALDFTELDLKLIGAAIGQANPNSHFLLIHVVESATAKMYGNESGDFESQTDMHQIENYAQQLRNLNYNVDVELGYRMRVKELARIINENNPDLLVIGSHGHSGLSDIIYGETINSLRHLIKVPILVINQ